MGIVGLGKLTVALPSPAVTWHLWQIYIAQKSDTCWSLMGVCEWCCHLMSKNQNFTIHETSWTWYSKCTTVLAVNTHLLLIYSHSVYFAECRYFKIHNQVDKKFRGFTFRWSFLKISVFNFTNVPHS